MRIPTLLHTVSSLHLALNASAAPSTVALPNHLLLPPLHHPPTTNLSLNLTALPTTRALLPLPSGKTLDITAYPSIPLPSPAYRWALFSILQDLRSLPHDHDHDRHDHDHPTDIVDDTYVFEEWGTVLRARTYQRYLVALTYEGLRQAVEALAVWLAGGNAWVCNGIVREGGGRGGRAVGFVSFELV